MSIFACLYLNLSFAQQNTFQLEFSLSAGDDARDAIQNAQGNYVVVGSTFVGGSNYDPVISIVSPTGVVLQTKSFASTTSDFFYSVCQTADGGYFLTGGSFVTSNNYDCLVVKLDSNLNTVFHKVYGTPGNDYGNSGFEVSPGRYTVTGTIALGGSAKPAVFTLDEQGAILSEGYLVTNQFASPNYKGRYLGNNEIAISNLTNAISIVDTNGVIVKNYPNSFGIYSTDITKTQSGEYVCVSVSNYGAPTGSTLSFAIIDSTLSSYVGGNSFKVNGKDILPVKVIQDANGDYLVAGNSYDFNSGNYIPILLKLDATGNYIWCNSFKPSVTSSAKFNSMAATSDGGVLLAGNVGPWNNQHFFVVKLDSAGNSVCNAVNYALTTQSQSVQSQTTHSQYTGSIGLLSTVITPFGTVTPTVNLICLSTAVKELNEHSGISIQPTLVQDAFTISSISSEPIELSIFDAKGKLILTRQVANGTLISLSDQASGYYFIKGVQKDGPVFSARVLRVE
ncbi:MAG: T9SS type A sorting domain-containing protein [Bacteroidetes bacterium]|nr:T9SS type A sorting domain-containing protein [Bacteroidota bacterium]